MPLPAGQYAAATVVGGLAAGDDWPIPLKVDTTSDRRLVVVGAGTAGAGAGGVLSIQGVAGGVAVPVSVAAGGMLVAGDILHHALDSTGGGPVKVGGYASAAAPAPVDSTDRVNAWFSLYGALRVQVTNTTGANFMPPMDTASNRGYIQVTDGTDLALVTTAGSLQADLFSIGGGAVALTAGQKTMANSIPVVIASDQATTVFGVKGDILHHALDSTGGGPVKIGGYASTAPPTAVDSTDRVNAWFTLNGAQMVALSDSVRGPAGVTTQPSAVPQLMVRDRGQELIMTQWPGFSLTAGASTLVSHTMLTANAYSYRKLWCAASGAFKIEIYHTAWAYWFWTAFGTAVNPNVMLDLGMDGILSAGAAQKLVFQITNRESVAQSIYLGMGYIDMATM